MSGYQKGNKFSIQRANKRYAQLKEQLRQLEDQTKPKMKVITPGHKYELQNFDNPLNVQTLQFIEKRRAYETSNELVLVNDGTTNEEVLRMMIDRLEYLNEKAPCRENSIVLTHLETALMWLEKRTKARKARGVEGTAAK